MISVAFFLLATLASAKPLAESPVTKVNFVELFTSESCSSCPPADAWFTKLAKQPGLWKNFVPAVFHVDYWNHLDWKDEYSSAAMSERQRSIARTWAKPSVYTPGVVLNGQEWQGWRMTSAPPAGQGEAGKLAIEREGDGFTVRFTPSTEIKDDVIVHLALLGLGIATKVTSGENSGNKLTHDFTVLQWENSKAKKMGKEFSASFKALESNKKTTRLAIIAWVSKSGQLQALQAAGNFL